MLKIDSPDIYKEILENLQVGICLVDRDQRIVFWNEGAERITGFLKQEVLGRCHGESAFIPSDESAGSCNMDPTHPLVQVLHDGKRTVTEAAIQHKMGYQIPVRMSASPIRDEQGIIIGAVESFDEGFASTDRDRRDSVLAHHGVLDEVTGVARSGFVESQLREHISMFESYPIPFSVLFIHIDGMDHWRATLGVGAISVILRSVAQTMENCIRPADSLGRWYENRFLCILAECSSLQIASVAERLRNSVRRDEIRWWGQRVGVTVSLGGATAIPGDSITSLLERADESLRVSIDGGGNLFNTLV